MRGYLVLAVVAAFPYGAQAQTPAGDPVEAMTKCRSIADSTARLACFDAAAAAVETARERQEIVVLDRGEVKKTRRSLFGFTIPRLKFLEGDGKEEVSEIETTVESVRALGYGKWAVGTTEGASWQTTEALGDTPRVGAKVRIRRGALGSYFLKIGNDKAARAKRTG